MVRVNPGKRHFDRYGEAFPECASLEAIKLAMRDAEARRRKVNRELEWLTDLQIRREEQIEAGEWPAKREATT